MGSTIESLGWVILRRDKQMKLVQIRPKQKEWISKISFTFDGAIGHHFGTCFDIVKGRLVKMDPKVFDDAVADDPEPGEEIISTTTTTTAALPETTTENDSDTHSPSPTPTTTTTPPPPTTTTTTTPTTTFDNRNLLDRDENQRLGRDDIEELRSQGLRGHQIIGHLVNNSLTFKGKTEYSREKYVKRKKRKHFSLLTILKPSTRLLCEMYYSKGPSKLCGLRVDTLTQMLSYSNVRAGSRIMIVESVLGVVLGAVMERMGGIGTLVHFYAGSAAQKPAYVGFDFPPQFHENYYEFPMDRVKELLEDDEVAKKEGNNNEFDKDGEAEVKDEVLEDAMETKNGDDASSKNNAKRSADDSSINDAGNGEDGCMNGAEYNNAEEDASNEEPPKKRFRRFEEDVVKDQKRQIRAERFRVAKNLVREKKMDGLIFCSRFHPTPIVTRLIHFVAPSRPIVIFNQFREPLIDVYNRLKNAGNVVNLKLSEPWMREYQVLEGRTHPLMQTSGGGGFLLTGYVVDNGDE